ncbi:MAG TPA: 1,4-dihydroxy-2-naphthoate octaprenyltransferase [Myxococcota bacterium]|nr:1,4-dihydroxy-2-naphthoate octaprenyltransferase [Myxococcota bacterium]
MQQAREWSRAEVWRRKLLYPAHTLPTAAAPVAVALGLAIRDGVGDPVAALFALLAGWLIQVGGVLTDNYENLVREPQDAEHPELVRALRGGTLTLAGLRNAILACYAAALLAGLYLVAHAGIGVLAIGVLAVAASVAYSAGPFPLGRHALGDPLFFLFFGIVSVVGAYYVQAAPFHGATFGSWLVADALAPAALLLGIPLGALTTNILIIDDIRDRGFDVVKGKRTIAVRWGARASRVEFLALLALAYLVPFGLWLAGGLGAGALLPLLTLPYAVSTAHDVLMRDGYEALLPATPKAGRLLLAYSLLLAAGIASQAFYR